MTRSSIALAFALPLIALGCEGEPTSTPPAGSGAPVKPAGSAKPASTAATSAKPAPSATASADAKPASTSAAAAFPATPLPSKNLADYTIGLPPGGKLDKAGEDKSALETPDYKLMLKVAGPKDSVAELKPMLQKMPGFKAITVDQADGLVIEMEEKGAKQFMLTRMVKVGDVTVVCDNALTKPPKDAAKAQEAYDVCGTIKKK